MVAEAHAPAEVRPEIGSIFGPAYRKTTFGLVTIISMIAFEAMAVGPALPTVARDLHGLGAYGWAFTSFLVANVIGMVIAGGRSDTHGPRLPMLGGMVLFTGGLVVAGTATTMAQLVGARFVQGIGSGLLFTSAYVLIGTTYPEALRPKVFATTSSSWVVPSLVGPPISGAVTQHASWRWVFIGLIPFVVAGSLLLLPTVRRLSTARKHDAELADPMRLVRAVVVGLGVAAISEAGTHPAPWTIALAVVGLVAFVWGVHGLVPPGTFRVARGVAAPVALRGLFAGAFFGAEALVPLMLTVQHHWSATEAGLPLAAAGVAWGAGSWFSGRDVADPAARRPRVLRAGLLLVAVAIALIGVTASPHGPAWLAYPAWTLAGAGAGLAVPVLSVLLLQHTNERDRGRDSSALQLSDTGAQALTTGVAGILVAAAAHGSIGYTTAFAVLDVGMVVLALLGAALSRRVRED